MISHEPIVWEGNEAEEWARATVVRDGVTYALDMSEGTGRTLDRLGQKARLVEACQRGARVWRVTPANAGEWEEWDEYAVLEADVPGECIVYARNGREWCVNPWGTRSLVRALIAEVEVRHGNA